MKRDYKVEVEWKAYELKSGLPSSGIPRPRKPGEGNELSSGVKRLSSEVGLEMKRPSFIASSRAALEAAEYAREKGRFDEFHLAVFKAYWEDGMNIGLRSVLREVAESCELNWSELARCLDEGHYTRRIEQQNEEARIKGITGVPAYIIGDYLIEGAQPYRIFQRAMEMPNIE